MPYAGEHEVLSLPPDLSTPIWRYMDLVKLIALLKDNALYFPRADTLGDPFEGSYSQPTVDAMREAFIQADVTMPEEALENTLRMMYEDAPRNSARMTYVSCWHVSDYESAAMWAYYVQHGIGVAIRSSVQRLIGGLKDTPDMVHIGLVHYVDYQKVVIPGGNVFWPFLMKRRSFEHEHELRAIVLQPTTVDGRIDLDAAPDHLSVRVDLFALIEAIYVAPGAWYRDVVQEVLNRFHLECEVRQSAMDDKPLG